MAFERSHGKMRPSLPRSSDLGAVEAAEKPTAARSPHGHFAKGNRTGVASRFTHTIRKGMGSTETKGVALVVARDARRVYANILPSLPSDAPPVRTLLTLHARHIALHGFYTCAAEAAGLDTERGLELLAVAARESQRAERVLVTTLDVATRIAAAAPKVPIDPLAAFMKKDGGSDG